MAYLNVSNRYKEVIYSGDAKTKPILKINNIVVNNLDTLPENNKIKSINKIHNIIKIGDNRLSLDNFVAQELEIQIYDFDYSTYHDSTLAYDVIDLSLSTLVDDVWETVPIGIFNIIGTPSSDKNLTIIKANCNRVKFDIPYNAQPLIEQYGGEVEIGILLQNICTICGVELGTSLPFINSTTKIGVYDSTINANIYVSYICEKAGSIAVSGRDGKLYLIPINNNLYKHLIDFNKVKGQNTQNYGDKFVYDRVVYEDGIRKLANPVNATNNTTIYINANNPYILEQQEIDNIYDSINGFNIENLKFEIYGDPTIDAWDLVSFTKDETEHKTLANNTLKYNGILMQTFDTNIGTQKTVQENVTIKNEDVAIKKLKVEQDQLNGTLTSVASQTKEIQAGLYDTNTKVEEVNNNSNSNSTNINKINDNMTLLTESLAETKLSVDSITNTVKITSGTNMVSNSTMLYGTDNYEITGTGNIVSGKITDLIGKTISESGFIIQNKKVQHNLISGFVVGKEYTITFKYSNTGTLKFNLHNLEDVELLNTNENKELEEFDYTFVAKVTDINYYFEATTDGNGSSMITDFIIRLGNVRSDWDSAKGEILSTVVSIYFNGIEVNSNDENIKVRMNNTGFVIINTSTNEITTKYTKDGMLTKNVEITGKIKQGAFITQTMTINNDSHYTIS